MEQLLKALHLTETAARLKGFTYRAGQKMRKYLKQIFRDIRLTNGQYVRFLNGSNQAFSSSAGTRYDFIVQLNRKATMQNCLIQSKLAATEVVEVPDQWTSISPSYSRTARFQNTGYYYFQIESNSSDTVIIMSAELLFS